MDAPVDTSSSPLEALSIARFGGKTYAREVLTAVPATRVNILNNNPNRVYWRLINEGGHDVRVSISPNLSATSGWILQALGGTIEMTFEDDAEMVGYTIYAIGNLGSSWVRSMEVIRS